jgi:hypothetical protein
MLASASLIWARPSWAIITTSSPTVMSTVAWYSLPR